MNFKKIGLGLAATAAMTAGIATAEAPAQAAGLKFGSVLNFGTPANGGVQFNSTTNSLNFFSQDPPPGDGDGQRTRITASTDSFLGANQGVNQTPPPPRISDVSLSGTGTLRSFVSTSPARLAGAAKNILLSGINLPQLPGNPNVAFALESFTYNTLTASASFRGAFYTMTGIGTNGDPIVLGQLLSQGVGTLTTQGNVNSPLFASYSGSITAVPTPALLPGLIGMGAAALRKKRKEGESEEALETAEVRG